MLLLLIIGLTSDISGQNRQIQFAVDHAQFRLQKDFVYLEIYYSIVRNSLTFNQVTDGFEASAMIMTYLSSNDSSVFVDSLIIQDFVTSMDQISPTQQFTEVSMVQIKTGKYVLVSKLTDLMSNQTMVYSDSLYLRNFLDEILTLSDLELAHTISSQQKQADKFDKNGLHVIPNASRIYGTGLPRLYFYVEAYNLKVESETQNSRYHSEYFILDQNSGIVTETSGRPRTASGNSSVIHGSLDISFLPAGIYSFKIKVADDVTKQTAETEKKFFVYKAEDVMKQKALTQETKVQSAEDEFMAMNESALNEYFEQVKYIATGEEIKLFKKLDLGGKRNFLVNFWRERDPDPQTEINERKKEYLQLLDRANEEFSLGYKPGWQTDRARILLAFGKPSQIDRFPASTDARAYQIWYYYELEGGVEFVFVDYRRLGDFQLVHSTKRNEIQNYDWKTHYVQE